MSRSFLGIPTFPLQTQIVGKPLLLAKKSSYPPTVVPINIDWTPLFTMAGGVANVGVTFNLLTSAVKAQIDIIQSVYIDNTASPIPVYIHFPSTGMTISVAPATSDWFPAVTEDLQVQVFALGLVTGQIPITQIMFTNVLVSPYSDPELNFAIGEALASPAISRGTNIFNTNFGVPALGDQTQNFVNDILVGTAVGTVLNDNMFASPQSGFIYLTHVDVSSINTSAGEKVIWTLDSLLSGGTTIYTFENTAEIADTQIYNLRLSAMNIKLDATKKWQTRVNFNALTGTDHCVIYSTYVWTNNPN
jgi:hypothetical protein